MKAEFSEVGFVKDDNGSIKGFFVRKTKDTKISKLEYVTLAEFVQLVMKGAVDGLFWDASEEKIAVDKNSDTMRSLKRMSRSIYDNMNTFEDWLRKDVAFNCAPENGLLPAAVINASNVLNLCMVTILMYCDIRVDAIASTLAPYGQVRKEVNCLKFTFDMQVVDKMLDELHVRGFKVVYCWDSIINTDLEEYTHWSAKLINFVRKPFNSAQIEHLVSILKRSNADIVSSLDSEEGNVMPATAMISRDNNTDTTKSMNFF